MIRGGVTTATTQTENRAILLLRLQLALQTQEVATLLNQMRETRLFNEETLTEWESAFAALENENRPIGLALLLFDVIRPRLVNESHLANQRRLLAFENEIRRLLQKLVPSVDSFLAQYGEHEKRWDTVQAELTRVAERVEAVTEMTYATMEATVALLRGYLAETNEMQHETLGAIREDLDRLDVEITARREVQGAQLEESRSLTEELKAIRQKTLKIIGEFQTALNKVKK